MSMDGRKRISEQRLREILSAVGRAGVEDVAETEVEEYSWDRPRYFSVSQRRKLEDFCRVLALVIGHRFEDLCHGEFRVTISSPGEYFGYQVLRQAVEAGESEYYLAFGREKEALSCVLGTPLETARMWVRHLLGDTEPQEQVEKGLSKLEESFLLEIGISLVGAFSECHGDYEFQAKKSVNRGQLPLELHGTEELCRITFGLEAAGSEKKCEAYFLVPYGLVEPVVGEESRREKEFSSEQISRAILERLKEMSVSVKAELASTALKFEEAMSLQEGDILLLDKRVDEPADVIVEGRQLFRGRPAKSAGKYAVVITDVTSPQR